MVDSMDNDIFELFDDHKRNTPNIDEYKADLKDARKINRAEYCEAIFQDLLLGKDDYLNSLEEQYQAALHKVDGVLKGSERRGISIRKPDRKNILDALHDTVSMGMYPPPEILLSIIECYEAYINAKGSLNLEDILCGKAQRGKGNFAKQKSIEDKYNYFEYAFMGLIGVRFPDGSYIYKNHTDAAEAMLKSLSDYDTDPESFLSSWRKWKRTRGKK